MGAKDSKPSCISYEDALKRVSENELRRIKDAFKKSAGSGGTTLSKNAFLQDVLSEGVPAVLADWLYGACGGQQRGISFKDLFCGLVLLTRGTQDEKIKFLWNVYCNESNSHIVKHEFTKALQIEVTYQPPEFNQPNNDVSTSGGGSGGGAGGGGGVVGSSSIIGYGIQQKYNQPLYHTSILVSLFGQSERVTSEQFKSWIITHKKATVLSKWLLLESGVNLSTELETPTFFQSLAGVTHLEEQDIVDLEKVFWLLKGSARTGQLDVESLETLITPPVPLAALKGVFLAFDENRDDHIDFKELCCGVSAACRGPTVERSKFCFKVFDIDRDGILNFDEIKKMINILIFVSKESNNSTNFKDITADRVLNYLRNRVSKTPTNEPPMTIVDAVADGDINNKDPNNIPFCFTQEDFMMWSVESSMNLVQPFLDLLFEVCHIVLGLRPQCRHLEYDIVKGWLSRERKRGYHIGQFWYLVSADWYQNWLQYTCTQNSTSLTCSFCKSTTNYNHNQPSQHHHNQHHQRQISGGGIDEAVVCDESFTSNSTESMGDGTTDSSSLGSGSSSGISMGRSQNNRPGIIDNSNLIAPIRHKNVPTLTGEGGQLKRDVILAEHRDYELVPESLWKALAQWYKGKTPLPRQVIQPPNSPNVDLELYPLNLRILRHQNPPVAQTVSSWGAVSSGNSLSGNNGGSIGSYTPMSATSVMNNSVVPSAAALQPPKRNLAYTAAFSQLATVKQVNEFLCHHLKLKYEDTRLWHVYNSGESCLLEDELITLQELTIVDNDQILLEIRNKDLTWPEELGSLAQQQQQQSGSGFGGGDRRPTLASIQSVHAPGATGLHNLGNTCFMNSALQVLFNTQPLTQYFIQNMHLYELNTTNKLGTKGQLALRYSELLKEVWTASSRSVAPLKLRFCMTKHAPQFAGGGQHDSQELLEWLLDALHEDLNRVMEKPYSELKDSDGRADSVVAAEAWLQHHSRNQSIVIDLFYGQLKSKVSCLGCGRDSVRFDPFSLLSLPLPVENYTYCEVLVILLNGKVPIKYGLRLNSDSRYSDLKKELSNLCQLDSSLMLICEIYNSQIRCVLLDEQKLKISNAVDLFVYEVPKGDFWRPRTSSELGMNIENGLKDIQRNPALLMPSLEPYQLTTTSNTSYTSSEDTVGALNGGSMTLLTNPLAKSTTLTTTEIGHHNGSNVGGGTERSSKQSAELSTSPEGTFVQTSAIVNYNRKSDGTMMNYELSSLSVDNGVGSGDDKCKRTNHFDGSTTILPPSPSKQLSKIVEIFGDIEKTDGNYYKKLNGHKENDDDDDENPNKITGCINDIEYCNCCGCGNDDAERDKNVKCCNRDDVDGDDDDDDDDDYGSGSGCGGIGIGKTESNGANSEQTQTNQQKLINNNNSTCDNIENIPLSNSNSFKNSHNNINNNNNNNNNNRKNNCIISSAINNKKLPPTTTATITTATATATTPTTKTIAEYEQIISSMNNNNVNVTNNNSNHRSAGGYLIAVHRKLTRQDTYFLSYHKSRPSLFGVPLLIPCYEGGTNKDLYCEVWLQVSRLLSPLPSTPSDQSNHATDCDDSLGYEFPFTLRAVTAGGRVCALCPWSKFCRGCEIPCNDDPLLKGNSNFSSTTSSNTSTPKLSSRESSIPSSLSNSRHNTSMDSLAFNSNESTTTTATSTTTASTTKNYNSGAIHIAIDWDPTALHLRYQSTREKIWTEHESVAICRKQQTEPVDLDHCLRSFTSEEKLEQWYHCAHCKGKQPATKKLQIWKLPPILIVHLKRFNYVNNKWVKSQKVVNFPFKDFDPTPYLASVPQETILRHKELLDHGLTPISTPASSTVPDDINGPSLANTIINDHHVDVIKEHECAQDAIELDVTATAKLYESHKQRKCSTNINGGVGSITSPTKRVPNISLNKRKRLVSSSLTQTPVIDGEFIDYHDHQLKDDIDPYDLKYQLYSVVSHSGMLNGGHYISYASNPNNAWYCYNDSSCREIPHQPNIDPGSAYLLFYERQGLNYSPYLPKVDGRSMPNGGVVAAAAAAAAAVDMDDADNDLRKTCVIS